VRSGHKVVADAKHFLMTPTKRHNAISQDDEGMVSTKDCDDLKQKVFVISFCSTHKQQAAIDVPD